MALLIQRGHPFLLIASSSFLLEVRGEQRWGSHLMTRRHSGGWHRKTEKPPDHLSHQWSHWTSLALTPPKLLDYARVARFLIHLVRQSLEDTTFGTQRWGAKERRTGRAEKIGEEEKRRNGNPGTPPCAGKTPGLSAACSARGAYTRCNTLQQQEQWKKLSECGVQRLLWGRMMTTFCK